LPVLATCAVSPGHRSPAQRGEGRRNVASGSPTQPCGESQGGHQHGGEARAARRCVWPRLARPGRYGEGQTPSSMAEGRRDGLPGASVRREARCCLPGAAGRNLEDCSWVNGLLDGETRRGQQHAANAAGPRRRGRGRRRKTRVVWSRLDCLKPNLQWRNLAAHGSASGTVATGCTDRVSRSVQLPARGRWPVRPFKGMSGRPTRRSDGQHRRTTGSPTGREAQGDGAVRRESRLSDCAA